MSKEMNEILLSWEINLSSKRGGCERIIGGDTVVPHSRPYMALLKLSSNTICAGALIEKNWVLTAAHCNVLKKKATVNRNVAILHLPKKGDDVKPGTRCRVAGWGRFGNKSAPSETLREVNITVIDRKICNDEKHYNFHPVIGLNMICAGDLRGGKDSCNGDSGSPLLCDGILRGITSFGGEKCGDRRWPGVYTFLSDKHLNWIKKIMKGSV
ncbi:granzyme A, isoform CRA_c [Mus musculus]|nr:granzyme A, isoform CRA_c [Mus musculus]